MRAFLRGVEAAIAVMIMLLAFQFLFNLKFSYYPHETRIISNLASSVLETYHSIFSQYILSGNLKSVDSILSQVIPPEYGYKFDIAYFIPSYVLFGSSGERPLMTTTDFSGLVDLGSVKVLDENNKELDSQVVWNWYRVPFTIINNEEAKNYSTQVLFTIPWQDTNNDGLYEPPDHESFTLYLNQSVHSYTLLNVTTVNYTDTVSVSLYTYLDGNETMKGYFYYKVIG